MNPFDTLSRSLPRSVDAQFPRDASAKSEVIDANGGLSTIKSFDTLLEGMSERPCREEESAQTLDDLNVLGAAIDGNSPDIAKSGVANPVFMLLEGLLSRASLQAASVVFDSDEQLSDASSQLIFQDVQKVQENDNLLNPPMRPRVTVTVQYQETHFMPLVEGAAAEAKFDAEWSAKIAQELPSSSNLITKFYKTAHPDHQNLTRVPLPQAATSAAPEEQEPAKDQSMRVSVERLEVRKNTPASMSQPEGTSFAPEMLQRLASSLRAEAHSMASEAAQHAAATDRMAHMFSIKASDSALRILNLQLHPADLGVVTVKMRLSGDTLEMELHTEKEETAQLLRHDSEKLSALLRGSGYRPDTITIQVNDVSAQDRVSTQKQSDMQFQGQSFQQGGSGQEGHPRNREEYDAKMNAESLHERAEDRAMGSRNSGSVYL